jgi:AsmA protein
MRKILIITGCGLAVVVAGLIAVSMLVDVNQFRGSIQSQLEKSLHRKVALGNMGLKLIPFSIRVQDFAVAEDPSFSSGKPFVSAKRLYVRVGLMALLRKHVEVERALLEEPSVELIKNKQGTWNFATLTAPSRSDANAGSSAPSFSLKQLQLENGIIAVTDQQAGKPRVQYDRIFLSLNDYTPGGRFTAQASGHLPGKHKEQVALKLSGIAGGTDVDGSFSLDGVSAGPVALSGDGTIRSRGNEATVKSSLTASKDRLARPLRIESTVQYNRASGQMTIAPLEIRADQLAVRGTAAVETGTSPIVYRADLQSDKAPVAELLSVANAFQFGQGVSGTGTLSLQLHVQGKGDTLAYNGRVTAPDVSIVPSPGSKPVHLNSADIQLTSSEPIGGRISAGQLSFDQITLTDVASQFRFAGSVLHLDSARARTFGGDLAGNLSVDARGRTSKIAANVKLAGVDAAQALAATTAVRVLSGKLSGDADLELAPQPGENPARGLNGVVRVLLTEGKISGIHLLDQLAQVAKFVGDTQTRSKTYTAISKLTGTMRIQAGVARTDDLQMDFDGGTLTATGTTDLADQKLDLSVAALLSKDVSQRVGGNKVGGYMTTVMASPQGELMIPAKVTGTFSQPRFLPDPARLAKMRFGSVGKAAATAQGILDQFTKPKSGQEGEKAAPADKAKPFTDLLNSLKKQK